ncbi:class F sortase [Microbacterium sp. BK668]|uniref:class F sortase n=1 Tax=Microbacterium sp. BK668 TaxID=2512118 RepID=UPI00105CD418|nr:class F sortase [Microbacterium sp. BK668]TDN90850.1 LPXTG-site transpeptidase (sortase) family protein [Microbacterium sp. BK668]
MIHGATRARGALVAAALAVCVVLPGCATPRQDDAGLAGSAPTTTQAPPPSATPSPAAPSPSAALGLVPVAVPTRLVFPAARIDGPVEEYTADDAAAEGGINPAGLDTISWYSGVADPMPGTDARNTVYIFGHSWIEPAVFNDLKSVRPGDEATLTTSNGELVYRVDEILTMSKPDFTQDPRVAAIVPGRLALVTCFRPEGWDPNARAPDNTVVLLQLVGARPAD